MSTLNVYSYFDATGNRKYADFNDVVFAGAWNYNGSYTAAGMLVVDYGQTQYICITDSYQKNPTTQPTKWAPTRYWSPFVLVVAAQGTTPDSVAYEIAVAGSNLAVQAYGTASAAYGLAVQAGTDAAQAAADAAAAAALASEAFSIAVAGTDAAAEALAVAQAGTAAAAAAQEAANGAFAIAVAGTELAQAAWELAQIGTDAAAAAQSTANGAFIIAVAGTNAASAAQSTADAAYALAEQGTQAASNAQSTADDALITAVTGSNLALSAYAIAVSGSAVGSLALAEAYYAQWAAADAALNAQTAMSIAVTGSQTANDAYAIAVTGTNAAAAAQSTADAAYALAQVGTQIPPLSTLPDVNIPAPTAQQVLVFDGSKWIAGDAPSTTSTGAFTFYLDTAPSGTLGYQTLLTVPASGTEEVDTLVITTGSGLTASTGFLSSALNRTRIDAGLWEFNVYGAVDTDSATLSVAILLVALDGTTTELFRSTVNTFTASTPVLGASISTQGSFAIQPTDKLLAQFYGTTSSATPVTLSFYHNGSEHYSHIHSPLVTSHNDLAGLQGGSSNANQFYHTTFDENEALTGTSGLPSASNPFVTLESLVTEQGTRSSQDQNLQNQVASASDIATDAYWLAVAGTNAAVALDNPTAEVSLSYVYGSGTKAMRSDAAPRLSQAIAPTWSGYHRFTKGFAVPTLAAVNLTSDTTTYLSTDLRGAITLSSTGSTPESRRFTLAAGTSEGQELTLIWTGTGAGEMLNNAQYGGCFVRLQSTAWRPIEYNTMLLRYNGADWLEMCRTPVEPHKACSIVLCSGYTPSAVGPDAAEIPVPYTWDSGSITWNVNRFLVRVQTAGSSPSAGFEKSVGDGGFQAVSMGTVTLGFSAYEGTYVPVSTTVDSGNKLRFYALDLGTAQNWTVVVELGV